VIAPPGAEAVERGSMQRARVVAAATLLVGAALLALALRLRRGSPEFYAVTLLVATTWTLPSVLVRPPRARGRTLSNEAAAGALVGALMFGVFVVAAAIGRHIGVIADAIDRILRKADGGPVVAVLAVALLNGVAEELFFRNTLIVALGTQRRRAYLVAFVLYVVVTAVSGNTALTLAAVVMGAVFAIERWRTGNLVAPVATHLVWSTLMILAFPR
jgi:membrane protease YdiL (CAAX protease family)